VYSRTNNPVDQRSSTSTSMNGSFTGRRVVMRMTGLPPRFSTAKRMVFNAGLNSMPACANALPEASCASSEFSSPAWRDTTSISARSGWPRYECTVSLPSPAACASKGSAKAAAETSLSNETGVFTHATLSVLIGLSTITS
jgi:hypothetical protein